MVGGGIERALDLAGVDCAHDREVAHTTESRRRGVGGEHVTGIGLAQPAPGDDRVRVAVRGGELLEPIGLLRGMRQRCIAHWMCTILSGRSLAGLGEQFGGAVSRRVESLRALQPRMLEVGFEEAPPHAGQRVVPEVDVGVGEGFRHWKMRRPGVNVTGIANVPYVTPIVSARTRREWSTS